MSENDSRYCTDCTKKVYPVRTFTAGVVILLLFAGILPGIAYYYCKERKCPHCSNANWDATQ